VSVRGCFCGDGSEANDLETSLVAAGDSDAEFLGETVAEIFREAVVEVARAGEGRVLDDERSGSRDGDQQPDEGRKSKAAERAEFEPEGVGRKEVMDDGEGKDEDEGREGGHGDERDIDGAMQLLAGAAVFAARCAS